MAYGHGSTRPVASSGGSTRRRAPDEYLLGLRRSLWAALGWWLQESSAMIQRETDGLSGDLAREAAYALVRNDYRGVPHPFRADIGRDHFWLAVVVRWAWRRDEPVPSGVAPDPVALGLEPRLDGVCVACVVRIMRDNPASMPPGASIRDAAEFIRDRLPAEGFDRVPAMCLEPLIRVAHTLSRSIAAAAARPVPAELDESQLTDEQIDAAMASCAEAAADRVDDELEGGAA